MSALPDELVLDLFTRLLTSRHLLPSRRVAQLRTMLWVCAQWRRVAGDASLWRGLEFDPRTAGILAGIDSLPVGCSLRLGEGDVALVRGAVTGEIQNIPVDIVRVFPRVARLVISDTPARESIEEILTFTREETSGIMCSWSGLRSLSFTKCTLSDAAVETMAPALVALKELRINDCPCGQFVLNELLAACPVLEALSFDALPVTGGVWALDKSVHNHAMLRELRTGARVHAISSRPVFTPEFFPSLTSLHWGGDSPADEGTLFGWDPVTFPTLTSLSGMTGGFTGLRGLRHVYPCLDSLTVYRDSSLRDLFNFANLPALKTLTVLARQTDPLEAEPALIRFMATVPKHVLVRYKFSVAIRLHDTGFERYTTPAEVGQSLLFPIGEDGVVLRVLRTTFAGHCNLELARPAAHTD